MSDVPAMPVRAWNLARAFAAFVADGCRAVSPEQFRERLNICDDCEFRRKNHCGKCGCRITLKAQARAWKCPAGRWPS